MEAAGLFAAYFSILFGLLIGICQFDLLFDTTEVAIFYSFIPKHAWNTLYSHLNTTDTNMPSLPERVRMIGIVQVVLGLSIIVPSLVPKKSGFLYLVRVFSWIGLVGWYCLMTYGHLVFMIGNTNGVEEDNFLYLILFPTSFVLTICAFLGMIADVIGVGSFRLGQVCGSLTVGIAILFCIIVGYTFSNDGTSTANNNPMDAFIPLELQKVLQTELPIHAKYILPFFIPSNSDSNIFTTATTTLSKVSWNLQYNELFQYFHSIVLLPTLPMDQMECLIGLEALIACSLIFIPSVLKSTMDLLLGRKNDLLSWLCSTIRLIGFVLLEYSWMLQWIAHLCATTTTHTDEIVMIMTSKPMLFFGGRVFIGTIAVLAELLDDDDYHYDKPTTHIMTKERHATKEQPLAKIKKV